MLKILKNIKYLIVLFVIILAITAGYLLKYNLLNWNLNFFKKDLKIDSTENVIREIKKISELTTVCFYQEIVVTEEKIEPNVLNVLLQTMHLRKDFRKNEIAIIAKGNVRAGLNLARLEKEDLQAHNDTLFVYLPPAEILDVIINPSGYEIYSEQGKWEHQEIIKIQAHTKEQLKRNAIREGILKKAEISGMEKMKSLFQCFGYSTIVLNFKK